VYHEVMIRPTPILLAICFGLGCGDAAGERPLSDPPPEVDPSKDPAIEAYWAWFSANSETLFSEIFPSKAMINALGEQLTKVAPGLEWMLETNTPRNFGVTALGKKELFPTVRALIRASPKLPKWRFFAFKQRSEEAHTFKAVFGAYTLDSDEMRFRAEKADDKQVFLTLFVKDLPTIQFSYVEKACYDFLEDALGEVDLATKVRSFHIESLPEAPA